MAKTLIPGITLNPSPYDPDNPNDRPAAAKPTQPTILSPTPAAPMPQAPPISIPGVTLKPPPYNPGDLKDRPGGAQPTTEPQGDSPLWTALQKPTHNISDLWDAAKLTGQGVGDYARVWGNQAIVPNALDRGLSTLPWSGGLEAEKAKTAAAEKDLGSFSDVAKWQGQNYNIAAAANRLRGGNAITQAIADSPISQGVIQGAGTIAGGNYDPMTIAKNAGTAVLESKAGKAVGALASQGASYMGNTTRSLIKKAEDEAAAALNSNNYNDYAQALQKKIQIEGLQRLHDIRQAGGDVAAKATEYANKATGAAADAYNNIAATASRATELPKYVDDAVSGAAGWLTGGPVAGGAALWANRRANEIIKNADVAGAIDQAFPRVTSYVKSAVDPKAWQQAASNAAIVAGGDYKSLMDKVKTFSPSSVIRAVPGSSLLGY